MAETPFRIPKTIAQSDMRNVNASAVLEYLRLAESASRTEISQQLKISKPTAMRIIDELEEGGFVISLGLQEVKRGRSRELLGINTKGNIVIAVDIGGGHISGVLADFGGEILYEIHEAPHWGNPEKNFKIIVDMIQRV
jgi:DNA-binding Lrp family transcriptional regulator